VFPFINFLFYFVLVVSHKFVLFVKTISQLDLLKIFTASRFPVQKHHFFFSTTKHRRFDSIAESLQNLKNSKGVFKGVYDNDDRSITPFSYERYLSTLNGRWEQFL